MVCGEGELVVKTKSKAKREPPPHPQFKLRTLSDQLKRMFPDNIVRQFDDSVIPGQWATPCMCGHHDHGHSGHCEHMCCTEDDDCDCGGFEPQPGMRLPDRKRSGPSLWSVLRV